MHMRIIGVNIAYMRLFIIMKSYFIERFEKNGFEALITELASVGAALSWDMLPEKFTLSEDGLLINFSRFEFKALKDAIVSNRLFDYPNVMDVIFSAVPLKQYIEHQQEEILSLDKEAGFFYEQFPLQDVQFCKFIKDSADYNYENLLPDLVLEGHRKFVIAERHNQYAAKKFILDNISYLREIGAVFVFESLIKESLESEIAACIENKSFSIKLKSMTPTWPKSDMHQDILEFAADGKHKMLEALCVNGIAIVAGETEASYSVEEGKVGIRLRVCNYTMVKNADEFLKKNHYSPDSIVFYFAGALHAKTEEDWDALGIADLTGATTLYLHDNYSPNAQSSIKMDHDNNAVIIKRNIADLQAKTLEQAGNKSALLKKSIGKFTNLVLADMNAPNRSVG